MNKYREGKMKRTLKRELKACEIGIREAIIKVANMLVVILVKSVFEF